MNNKNHACNNLLLLVTVIALQGCASISSTRVLVDGNKKGDTKGVEDGVVYFMPKRPIRISYSISENKTDKKKSDFVVSVDDANIKDMAPDTSNMFVLRYNKNYVGKNHMYIDVDRNGLLSVSHADTLSRMNEIVQNIGKDVVAVGMGVAPPPASDGSTSVIEHSNKSYFREGRGTNSFSSPTSISFTENGVCKPGSYSKLVDPKEDIPDGDALSIVDSTSTRCGLDVKITRAFEKQPKQLGSNRLDEDSILYRIYNFLDIFHSHNSGYSLPGLFYREEMPYIVTVNTNNSEHHLTASSPTESATYFAPITKTFFANNTSDISLSYGVMDTIEETTDSEAWAASKAPADFIGSYTDATLKGLENLKGLAVHKTNLLDEQGKLSKAEANYGAAQAASLAKAQKELIDAQISLANAQAKKQNCDYLLSLTKGKKGDDRKKALDEYNAACNQ